jgi:hypothetical protein
VAAQFELTQKYSAGEDKLLATCEYALKMCDFSVEQVDLAQRMIQAKANFTIFSFGERIEVAVGGDGAVWVRSRSVQSTAKFDYGKNKRNVDMFFAALELALAGGASLPNATPIVDDEPDVIHPPVNVSARVPVIPPPKTKGTASLPDRGKLRRAILDYFSESELEDLCFDMAIDHERFPAKGKAELVRELIAYCERNDRTVELVKICQELRPGIEW